MHTPDDVQMRCASAAAALEGGMALHKPQETPR
jgi:hypothetical protein